MAIRDVIFGIVPASWRDRMIADSKRWIATCRTCRTATSIWDMGGVRWRASGNKVVTAPCATCRGYRRHDLRWTGD